MAREYNWNVKNKATKGYEVRKEDGNTFLRCYVDIAFLLNIYSHRIL